MKKNKNVYEIVEFKSNNNFFIKERLNIKNNTVRIKNDIEDERFYLLDKFILSFYNLKVKIVNSNDPTYFFFRDVKDVSLYKDIYIITWEV